MYPLWSVYLYCLFEGATPFCDAQFIQKFRNPDLLYGFELPAGSVSQCTRKIGFSIFGSSFQNDMVPFLNILTCVKSKNVCL